MATLLAESKSTRYRVKAGAPIPANKAQLYGECLQRLSERNKGRLDAEIVVREAKDPRCAIHDYFEWNDRVAADEYRKEQARGLLRCIVYIEEKSGKEVRAFTNVDIDMPDEEPDHRSYYIPTEEVLADQNLMAQVLLEAMEYLKWFRQKYALLKELSEVHSAIDHAMTNSHRLSPARQDRKGRVM